MVSPRGGCCVRLQNGLAAVIKKRRSQFIDLTGTTVAGAQVLREVPSVRGCARWRVLLACGCESNADGAHLRECERKGRTLSCALHRIHKRRAITKSGLSESEKYQIRKAATPGNRGKGSAICRICHSMPWRVKGKRCANPSCGLRKREEVIAIDYGARRPLAWL
jgi:hypothetical protein